MVHAAPDAQRPAHFDLLISARVAWALPAQWAARSARLFSTQAARTCLTISGRLSPPLTREMNRLRRPVCPSTPIPSCNWSGPSASRAKRGVKPCTGEFWRLPFFYLQCCCQPRRGPGFYRGLRLRSRSRRPSARSGRMASVQYFTDQGDLSPILPGAQADAFVASAFSAWTSIAGVALTASQGGHLAEDVNGSNIATDGYGTITAPADITSSATGTPIGIVYDYDGTVTDALLGQGAGGLAFVYNHPPVHRSLPSARSLMRPSRPFLPPALLPHRLEAVPRLNPPIRSLSHRDHTP